jgi:hypothetical protein
VRESSVGLCAGRRLLFSEQSGLKLREPLVEFARLVGLEIDPREEIPGSPVGLGGIEQQAGVGLSAGEIGLVEQ